MSVTQAPSRPTHAIVAGLVTALVGWTSSFAVVLGGLRAVGASSAQAASGLLALSLTMGVGCIVMARSTRLPITIAWSTPGAALLVGTGAVAGGWPAAVGAFLVCGVLIALTGVWPLLGALVGRIPTPIAQGMLAGVLVPICLAPVKAAVASPALVLPVVAVWLVGLRFAPRWAVPAAFALTLVLVAATGDGLAGASPWPTVEWTTPHLGLAAVVGIALPLYLVTMASQNVPGVAVLGSFGFEVPWRRAMTVTGAGTLLGAPFGGHAINLAAISAALAASPEADPDPKRRWIAADVAGWFYLLLGLASAAVVGLAAGAPPGLVEAAAGLALLPTLASSLAGAISDAAHRIPAAVTFLVGASGIAVAGVGPAFWSLVAGLIVWAVLARPATSTPPAPAAAAPATPTAPGAAGTPSLEPAPGHGAPRSRQRGRHRAS